MAAADVVVTGTVLTVDDARPTAEALAIAEGRIVAVGSRADVADRIGPDTRTVDVGDGCVMPGFVEAHGHPLMEAVAPQMATEATPGDGDDMLRPFLAGREVYRR